MDRKIVWPGQVPLETDLLGTNRNVMVALGRLAQDILGTSTLVSGLSATPTTPASLSVRIGPGAIYSLQPVDGTAYSSLPANTSDYVLKQGIIAASDDTLLTFTPPAVSGQSVIFLIQAAYSEVDTDGTVLPFYNASNPAVPYSGPSNTGASSATTRAGNVNVAIKAGAPSASPTPPAADAGFVPLYYVTVSYGQTTITSANIATATGAPFISATLPQIAQSAIGLASLVETIAGTITNKAVTPAGLAQAILGGSYHFAADTGAVNALSISMTPAPTGYTTGMSITVRAANTTTGAATMNVNGLGARAITFAGSPLQPGAMVAGQIYTLVYDGAAFQLGSGVPAMPVITAFSFGSTGGYIQWSNGFKIQVQRLTFSASSSQTFSYMSAFNNDSFAWVNGDDGVTDVSIYVTSTTASTATVHSSTSGSFAITLFSIGY
ncbi:MAG: hypothetical protein OC190_00235 [Novosphingobium aromaticivorans]|nr:hypothetical protein [Novosphingobium aromaticivorans]